MKASSTLIAAALVLFVFSSYHESAFSQGRERNNRGRQGNDLLFPYKIPSSLKKSTWEISIDTKNKEEYLKTLNGFNANVLTSSLTYDDAPFLEMVKELKLNYLRFPGGTVANHYNWKKDTLDAPQMKAPDWLRKGVKELLKLKKKYGYKHYLNLVEKCNLNPIIVVNIQNQRADGAVKWITELKKDGLKVKYVELGNEIYFGKQNIKSTSNVSGYVKICKSFAKALKKAHPELVIGVTAGPFFTSKWNPWNISLGKESFFDAVIYHDYEHHPTPKKDPQKALVEFCLASEIRVESIVKTNAKIFKKKPIWMTEWNFHTDTTKKVGNTIISPLYAASYFLSLVDNMDVIKISCYDKLEGNMIRIPSLKRKIKMSIYPGWVLVGEAAADANETAPLKIKPEKPNSWKFSPLVGRAFFNGDEIKILAVNRTPLKKDLVIKVDKKTWTRNCNIAYFSSENLSQKLNINSKTNGIIKKEGRAPVSIQPYSVNVITIKDESKK